MIFSDSFNGIDARIGCRSSVVEARKPPKYKAISSSELAPAPEGAAGGRAKAQELQEKTAFDML